MNKATKATMMSAFVFPGAGLFIVKAKVSGVLAAVFCLMNLSVIGSILYATVEHRIQGLLLGLDSRSGNPSVDVFAPLSPSDTQTLITAFILLTVVWTYSIFLSWKKGQLLDQIEEIRRQKELESDHYAH